VAYAKALLGRCNKSKIEKFISSVLGLSCMSEIRAVVIDKNTK